MYKTLHSNIYNLHDYEVKSLHLITTSTSSYVQHYSVNMGIKFKLSFLIFNVLRNSDNCKKAYFTINFPNTHQHFYLNPYIVTTHSNTTTPNSSYFFKVY